MAVDPKTLKVGDRFRTGQGTKVTVQKVVLCESTCSGCCDSYLVDQRGSKWGAFDNRGWWGLCEMIGKETENSTVGVDGHPRFLALLDELRSMHVTKSADYGTTEDCYANYRKTASLGINPSMGILIRMADKWSRIETWANGGTLKNEGVKDSLMDLASYALCAVVMIEEEAVKC